MAPADRSQLEEFWTRKWRLDTTDVVLSRSTASSSSSSSSSSPGGAARTFDDDVAAAAVARAEDEVPLKIRILERFNAESHVVPPLQIAKSSPGATSDMVDTERARQAYQLLGWGRFENILHYQFSRIRTFLAISHHDRLHIPVSEYPSSPPTKTRSSHYLLHLLLFLFLASRPP